jgi:hypothetical protein
MRRVVAIATAAGATLALLSCQVLFPDVVVNGDGGPADGETLAPDVAADVAVDRAATDAGSSDAVAADGPFCDAQPPHWRCYDFDMGGVTLGWDGNNFGTGAAVVLDNKVFVSSPYSMQSSVPNGTAMGAYAVLTDVTKPNPSQIVLAAEVRPALPTGATYDGAELLGMHFTEGAGYYGVGLGVSPAGPGLSIIWPTEGGYESMSQMFPSLVPDDAGWTEMVMTINFGPPLEVTVTFNGAMQGDMTFQGTAALADASTPGVAVGIVAVGDGGPLVVNYDNVTIDVK